MKQFGARAGVMSAIGAIALVLGACGNGTQGPATGTGASNGDPNAGQGVSPDQVLTPEAAADYLTQLAPLYLKGDTSGALEVFELDPSMGPQITTKFFNTELPKSNESEGILYVAEFSAADGAFMPPHSPAGWDGSIRGDTFVILINSTTGYEQRGVVVADEFDTMLGDAKPQLVRDVTIDTSTIDEGQTS